MDLVERSAVTPRKNKSRLARAFAKVLHIRSVTGIAPDDEIQKIKPENVKNNLTKNPHSQPLEDKDEKLRDTAIKDAFLAKVFVGISTIKAAYAELQFAQSPYDPDGIQSADEKVVSELKNLSELKQCFLKQQLGISSPEMTLLLAEIQENKSLLKTYEITGRKLDSEVKLKESEITFLKEKLEEANTENKLLEKRLNLSGQLSVLNNLTLSRLIPGHFIIFLRQAIKSVRSFVKLLISELESAGWDLVAASDSIEPGIVFWKSSDICYVFESFVCREMFDGFDHPEFSLPKESSAGMDLKNREMDFSLLIELKSVKLMDYLAWKPKSRFSRFCHAKYLRLVHPKVESSLFGNLDQRHLVQAGEFPETSFFLTFAEMARRIWLLHCLAFSFNPEASIFQVNKGSHFSEVYMESVCEEPFLSSNGSSDTEPRVAFTVIPGFRIGRTAIQCQVYLC